MKNFKTRRILTLTISMVLLAGSLVSATEGYFDTVSASMGFVGQLLRATGIVARAENAPNGVDDSPLSTETWTGGAGNTFWTNNGNWSGIGGAGPDDDLIFPPGLVTFDAFNDFPINTNFNSLTFTDTDYDITGAQIILANGMTVNIPGGGPFFEPNIILGNSQTWTSSNGFVSLTGVVNLNGHTLTLTGSGDHVLHGLINGTGTITKNGAGNATINNDANGFGSTNINAGTLQLGVNGTLGTANLNSGTLQGRGATGAIVATGGAANGVIAPGNGGTNTGNLSATAVTMAATSTFAVDLNSAVAFDQLIVNGQNVFLNGANLEVTLNFTPIGGQQFTIINETGAGILAGQFAQGASIVVDGQIFTITYNTSSVVLTAQGSTLTWDGGGADNNWSTAANWNPNVAVADGLDLVFPAGVPADRLVQTNNIVGLDVQTLTFNANDYSIGGNAITLSGGITVNTNAIGTSGPLFNPDITLTQAQIFSNNGLRPALLGGTLNLNGALIVDNSSNFIFSGQVTGAGGITKTGTGTLFLQGMGNNYTGITNINNGYLQIRNVNSLGATGAGNNTVVATGASLLVDSNILNVPEAISLNGTGVGGSGAIQTSVCSTGCSISGPITLASNSSIGVVTAGDTLTLNGAIGGGANGLTKVGVGTLIQTATNTYGGATNVNAGTLLVNGDSGNTQVTLTGGRLGGSGIVNRINASAGTIAPGNSAGTLSTNGIATLQVASTFNVEIGGTAQSQYDHLVVGSNATLNGGNLTASLINGFNPAAGDTFTILSAVGTNGQFAQGDSITIGGRPFSITYNNSVVLTALPVINGTVTYGNAAAPPKFISNATVTGTGSPNVSTTTAAPGATAGQYSLSGFGAGAYTVSLSKTTGQNGIGSNDAARVAQHVAATLLLTTDNQRVSADVSGNGIVSSNDAAKIAQFVAGLPISPPNFSGTWRFFVAPGPTFPVGASPTSRTYASITNDIAGDDYIGLLIGDVTGNWAPSPLRPANGPERSTGVRAPHLVTPTDKEVVIPVSVEGAAEKGIISYEFNLRYDPSVIQPQKEPVDLAGTVSSGLSAVANPNEPGLLRVVVYGAAPIGANGVLLNLKFTAVGAPGSVSPLTWERLMFNEGDPQAVAGDGQIEISKGDPNQAEISGRLLTAFGKGVTNTRVTLTDTTGQSRSVVSNRSGGYRFGRLQSGQTYTIGVESKRYRFTPLTVSTSDQLVNLDLIAAQ